LGVSNRDVGSRGQLARPKVKVGFGGGLRQAVLVGQKQRTAVRRTSVAKAAGDRRASSELPAGDDREASAALYEVFPL
jgi:hypothetical protein